MKTFSRRKLLQLTASLGLAWVIPQPHQSFASMWSQLFGELKTGNVTHYPKRRIIHNFLSHTSLPPRRTLSPLGSLTGERSFHIHLPTTIGLISGF
jgi:hypothetical protein